VRKESVTDKIFTES